jgi:hypothetical protein
MTSRKLPCHNFVCNNSNNTLNINIKHKDYCIPDVNFATVTFCDTLFIKRYMLEIKHYTVQEF